jgi:RNA polymerase sigma-70 factor (ECF subfamily)
MDQKGGVETTMPPRDADAPSVANTFEELVGPWVDEMYRAAAAIVGEADARDVTQEALLDAWRGFARLRDRAQLRPWLHAILANRSRKHLRARRSRPRLIAVASWPETGVDDRSAAFAERERLDRAFDSLPADQRIALALHYTLDLSVPQVASVLSVPEGTVKSRIHAGVERLRTALAAEDTQ